MPTDTAFTETPAPAHTPSLPAGAGIALAVIVGSLMWIGIFAMIL